MIGSILTLLLAASFASASLHGVDPNTLSCDPSGMTFLLLPHFTECDRFYMCVHGNEVEFNCAPGTIFDFPIQVCNHPWATQCWLRTSPEEPTPEPTTAAPNTTVTTTTAVPTTAEPTTAEPTTAEPTTAEPTTAEPTTPVPTTAEPTTTENYETTTIYDEGSGDGEDVGIPDYSGEGSGDIEEIPFTAYGLPPPKPVMSLTPSIIDCSSVKTASRQVPYTGDCQKFWRCEQGLPQVATCNEGLLFNPFNQQCDLESNVRCDMYDIDELHGEFLLY